MKKIILSLLLVAAVAVAGWWQKTINDPNAEVREAKKFQGDRII